MGIETILPLLKLLSPGRDDDAVDRMNYHYTPNVLLALSVLISFKQFGGNPIECVMPAKVPGSWEQYTENYCWSQDSYFVDPELDVELIPPETRYNSERRLSYYQWVPFVLLLQAACFRLPNILWRCAIITSGLQVHEFVKKAADSQNVEETIQKKNLAEITKSISKALSFHQQSGRRSNWPIHGNFIGITYLITKLCYLANAWMQFYIINWFLQTNTETWYGFDVINDLIQGKSWEISGNFPRVSICDFTIRQVANIQRFSVQCVLVINIFNEKIFLILWFWYIILAVSTVLSFLYWFTMLIFSCSRENFINSHINNMAPESKIEKSKINSFTKDYLKMDGIFVLRMITMHAGIIFGYDLISSLYDDFYCSLEKRRQSLPKFKTVDFKNEKDAEKVKLFS